MVSSSSLPAPILQQSWLAHGSADLREAIKRHLQWVRYRPGQTMLQRDRLPHQVMFIADGKARLVADSPQTGPFTLARLGPGDAIGWCGLVREQPCETVLAMDHTLVGAIQAKVFLDLLKRFGSLRQDCRAPALAEMAEVLFAWLERQPFRLEDPTALLETLWGNHAGGIAVDAELGPPADRLDPNLLWLWSNPPGQDQAPGDELERWPKRVPHGPIGMGCRALGLPRQPIEEALERSRVSSTRRQSHTAPEPLWDTATEAPDLEDPIAPEDLGLTRRVRRLPPLQERGDSPYASAMVTLQRLASLYRFPFPRDTVQQVLFDCEERLGGISLLHLGQLLESLGLEVRPLSCSGSEFHRLEPPALLRLDGRFVLLEEAGASGIQLSDPAQGVRLLPLRELRRLFPDRTQLMLVRPAETAAEDERASRFDLAWFWEALAPYRPQMALVLLAGFVAKVLELVFPLSIFQILDVVVGGNNPALLRPIVLVLAVVLVVLSILNWLKAMLLADLSDRIDTRLGSQVVGHLFRLPLKFFDRRTVGDLSSRFSDLTKVRKFLTETALSTVLDLVMIPIVALVLFLISPPLALLILLQVPLLLMLNRVTGLPSKRLLTRRNQAWGRAQGFLVETLTAIRTVKSQNFATQARWQWLDRYRLYTAVDFRYGKLRVSNAVATKAIALGFRVAVFATAAWMAVEGTGSVGSIVVIFILGRQLIAPLINLSTFSDQYREAKASMDGLADVLGQVPEESIDRAGLLPLPRVNGRVDFERVSFGYGVSSEPVLDQFSLAIAAGSFVGLVGLSGSGKSTVVQLIDGLYKPLQGRIYLDGVDINKVQIGSLRRQVGFVPQESILFDGTIIENLRLNMPDAPFDAVVEAATTACAHDFIMALPDGYNTRVGERGGALSGGQKQRVAIARMVLQNPNLVILDEATSALDTTTEQLVLQRLRRRFAGCTLIVVTHRVSTLREADRILLMEGGAVLEDGSWEDLLQRGGSFAGLATQPVNVVVEDA
ncbi:ATP-binding cassette domain-containing protein [Synechococcus sp. RSCCF101]|uniref:peptidase domain-containing ABC transporter n=1 Tax=Synechococcus sp. RSCCF101 TaxID=2511069 RepID=UPI001243E9B7|nr:peptidase domain-containing ABC transporter [Synechococcus sp. RSCCF101]QEY32410.1 ATP-binding cassette domain-containing protein [Synechococcus sp. RSCCF101]